MAMYYLMSQLPSLDGISDNMPIPITEARFLELCQQFLGRKSRSDIEKMTLAPSKDNNCCNSVLLTSWNNRERNLRFALAKLRAAKMNKAFDAKGVNPPSELMSVAAAATDIDDPLEAEKYLDKNRMDYLESLRPMDTFSNDSVFYYGIKLKLLWRSRKFDSAIGEAAYKNIYNSIVNGNSLEDVQ